MNLAEEKELSAFALDLYLTFEVGFYTLALSIRELEKVNWHEQLRDEEPEHLFDLGSLLGLTESKRNYRVDLKVQEKRVSFWADNIGQVKNFQLAVWLAFPAIMRSSSNRLIDGFFFDGDKMVPLLNFSEIDFDNLKKPDKRQNVIVEPLTQINVLDKNPKTWLTLWAGTTRFAVELERVLRVIEHQKVFKVPMVDDLFSGVIYFEEEAVPVIKIDYLDKNLSSRGDMFLLLEQSGDKLVLPIDKIDVVRKAVPQEEREGYFWNMLEGDNGEKILGLLAWELFVSLRSRGFEPIKEGMV